MDNTQNHQQLQTLKCIQYFGCLSSVATIIDWKFEKKTRNLFYSFVLGFFVGWEINVYTIYGEPLLHRDAKSTRHLCTMYTRWHRLDFKLSVYTLNWIHTRVAFFTLRNQCKTFQCINLSTFDTEQIPLKFIKSSLYGKQMRTNLLPYTVFQSGAKLKYDFH